MKLGVIGFGTRLSHMVNNCMRPLQKDLRVVAAIDPDADKVREALGEQDSKSVQFYNSVEDMVEKSGVDAIAIGTRCNLHAAYAIQAAKTGLPLFLEKPVAINLEEAIALEKAFTHSKPKAVVSFPLRASPLCRQVKQMLENGDTVMTEHVMAQNYVPYGDVYFNSWYKDYTQTGGLLLQKATHDFDYLAYCMRSPITRVAATVSKGRVYRDSSLSTQGGGYNYFDSIGSPETGMNEDSSNVLLEFANGAKGVYTQVFYAKKGSATRGATFSGRDGTLRFDWCRDEAIVHHHFEPFVNTLKVDSDLNHHGGDGVLAENFLKVVTGEARPIATIWNGLQSVYACLAARTSAETGTFQDVRQLSSNVHALNAEPNEQ